MKKSILVLISNLESGGVSKSVVSLLNTINREQYDVSLWIASPTGVFLPQIPHDVKLVTDYRITALLDGFRGCWTLIKQGNLMLALGSGLRMLLSKVSKSYAGLFLAHLMPQIGENKYNLIVDYNGQHQLYYMIDKLQADVKITFFHNDYRKWPFYYSADKKYFAFADGIYSISEECVEALKEVFPQYASKVFMMENISSPRLIEQLSEELVDFPPGITLVTVAHVCRRKGSDWAIEAARILKERGLRFTWIFVGKVIEQEFVARSHSYGLSDFVKFIGVQSNPYPYMKKATIIVHPSRFEGKSIALDEAKILCKPIVVTNFSTVHDQFQDRINASICSMDSLSIANAIEELVKDASLRKSYIGYLQTHQMDNTSEINKIYKLLS